MPANTNPLFGLEARHTPDGTWTLGTSPIGVTLNAAVADTDGTGANYQVVATGDATNGSILRGLSLKPKGTNVLTALRVFLNNGGAPGTAANNGFWEDMALPATTLSGTAQIGPRMFMAMDLKLAPGEVVLAGLATAVAAGWEVIPVMEKL